jgi:hypothetical protein
LISPEQHRGPFPLVKLFYWQRLIGTLFFLVTRPSKLPGTTPRFGDQQKHMGRNQFGSSQSKFSDKDYNFDVHAQPTSQSTVVRAWSAGILYAMGYILYQLEE